MSKNPIQVDNNNEYGNVDSWSFTSVETEVFTHRWSFQKNALRLMKKEKLYFSRPFFGGRKSGHTWKLCLRKMKHCSADCLGIYLFLKKPGKINHDDTLIATFQFNLLDENDSPVHQLGGTEACSNDFLDVNSWGFPHCMKMKDLFDSSKHYFTGDELKIHCRISLNRNVQTRSILKSVETDYRKNLCVDFKNMLESSIHHDVVIETGTNLLKAHKAVLSARSPVFAAMFQTEMEEATSGQIILSDFSEKVIKEMLNFMYSGEVENLKANIVDLFTIADKYDIKDLTEECIRNMPSALTCDNAVEILFHLNKYSLPEVKSQVAKFIASNKDSVKNSAILSDEVKELVSVFL